jgi:hypothetical protein
MTRRWNAKSREAAPELTSELRHVLESGFDLLGYFSRHLSPEELCEAWRRCWQMHGAETLRRLAMVDPSIKPLSWFWFSSPVAMRVPFGERISKTEMRKRLLAANLLDAQASAIARMKIARVENWTGGPRTSADVLDS